ncbi:Gti1/Pac2 family-domain-containing protein [Rhodocollybia butyracea]|uniref:Gti1/Pac2 family-domain-containing protein n=1 Tax=Rhodocollybia butyracea TaxID=206335 RepID=A0A9P5UCW6_9AGAR|nr:Gti1/Pac2 family-domain-containing protein [Rhodocollybia butyracea]
MSSASQQSPATTWNEPPWTGWIETTQDALLILEAARQGLVPRVRRRLVDSERKLITSGSVFVFDEDESGIKRWTDGFFWSPSRILGNFLLYRETEKRGPGPKGTGPDDSADASASQSPENHSLSRPKTESTKQPGVDKLRERSLVGSLTNSDKFKSDGLMKKTFSLNINGVSQHLISYYRIEDVENGRLRSPSSLPELASLDISPEYLDKTHFRNPPKVEVGPDGVPRYRGEADDVEPTSSPLSTGLPLLTDGRATDANNTKRLIKRFEPYPSTSTEPTTKKQRRHGKSPESPDDRRSSSQTPTPTMPSGPSYSNAPSTSSSGGMHIQPQYPGHYALPVGYAHPQPVYPYHPPTAATGYEQGTFPLPTGPSAPYNSPPYPVPPPTYYGYPAPRAPYPYSHAWSSYPGYLPAPHPPQHPQPPPASAPTQEENET